MRLHVLLGVGLITIGLAVNQWLLLYLFPRPDGSIALDTKVIIWIFQFLCIGNGLLVLAKGATRKGRKELFFGYVTIALMFVVLEVALQVVNAVTHFGEFAVNRYKYLLSPYHGKPWAEQLFAETDEVEKQYVPYLGWDAKEYHGTYVNVDRHGVRATWNPDRYPVPAPDTVYVFGGSTTWGWGARDDYTIPSCLSRLLNQNGYACMVYNYGEEAYTFTQELVQLIFLLRAGHRPTYVVFYDGINDVYGTYQSGVAGTIHNLKQLRSQLETRSIFREIWRRMTYWFENQCMTYTAIRKAISLVSPSSSFPELMSAFSDERLRSLAEGTSGYYMTSMTLLDRLSQVYGFKYLCFWQPTMFTEVRLTDEEKTVDPRLHDQALGNLFRYTTDILADIARPHFHVISDAIAGRTQTCYLDMCHLSEEGNEMVAARIFQILKAQVLDGAAGRAGRWQQDPDPLATADSVARGYEAGRCENK